MTRTSNERIFAELFGHFCFVILWSWVIPHWSMCQAGHGLTAGLGKAASLPAQSFKLGGGNGLARLLRETRAKNHERTSLQRIFLASRIGKRVGRISGG